MKILVLSDVHGNAHALEAVFDAAPVYDEIVCLGDIVGYGARPNECCDLLRASGATCLLGNHDAAAIGKLDPSWFNTIARAAIEWTSAELSDGNLDWLDGLKPQIERPDLNFEAVHGSLREPLEEYITGVHSARPTLDAMTQPLCFFGHTHVAEAHFERNTAGSPYKFETQSFARGGKVELREGWKTLLNPGSVGQPRDGNRQARAALLDSNARTVEVLCFDYDIAGAKAAILEADLPRRLADRLEEGR